MPLPRALRALACAKPTVAPVPGRALIAVTGSQAGEFLNGLTAASVPNSPSRGHFYTAFLQAQVSSAMSHVSVLTDVAVGPGPGHA